MKTLKDALMAIGYVCKEQKKPRVKKERPKVDFVCGRMFLNSVGKPVCQCADWVWQEPGHDQYRVWIVGIDPEDGPWWCKDYVTMKQFQDLVAGLKYTDDQEKIDKLEKEFDNWKKSWKTRRHKSVDMFDEILRPITNKNRRNKSGKFRRF